MTNRRKAYIAEFLGTAGMGGFGLLAVALFWSSSSPLSALPVTPAAYAVSLFRVLRVVSHSA